jgi:hypothetical protein
MLPSLGVFSLAGSCSAARTVRPVQSPQPQVLQPSGGPHPKSLYFMPSVLIPILTSESPDSDHRNSHHHHHEIRQHAAGLIAPQPQSQHLSQRGTMALNTRLSRGLALLCYLLNSTRTNSYPTHLSRLRSFDARTTCGPTKYGCTVLSDALFLLFGLSARFMLLGSLLRGFIFC